MTLRSRRWLWPLLLRRLLADHPELTGVSPLADHVDEAWRWSA